MSQNQSLNTKKHFFTHLKKCFSLVYRLHQTAASVRLSAIKYSFQREITQERETVNTRETTQICRKADSTSSVLQWLRHGCSCLLYRHSCFKGKMKEKERNKVRWLGEAQRSDKSDIDISILATLLTPGVCFLQFVFFSRAQHFAYVTKEPYETFSYTLFY